MRILDELKYPDGISSPLEDLNDWVWEKGYYCQTEEGIWYELYLSRDQRKYYPNTKVLEETMEETNYDSLYLGNFEEYNQITFFVPNDEEEWTYEELTDKFM